MVLSTESANRHCPSSTRSRDPRALIMHASQVPGVVWSSDHCAVGTEVGALEMALPGLFVYGAFVFPSTQQHPRPH